MNKKGKKSKHNVFSTLKEVPVNPLSDHILLHPSVFQIWLPAGQITKEDFYIKKHILGEYSHVCARNPEKILITQNE